MGHDQASPRASSTSAPLLPSHRFYSNTIKASPIYAIPAHYLKRRGALLLIVCMATISYAHYLYLLPMNPSRSNFDKSLGLPDYMSIGEIREPPLIGPAPINGVDENGFEVLEELLQPPTVTKNVANMDKTDIATSQNSTAAVAAKTKRPIQFNFRDTFPRTGARADLNKQRLTVIKDMIQHAWTGYAKHAAPHDELKPVTGSKIDSNHGWGATLIDSLDTLLLAGMTEEYQVGKRMFLDGIKQHQWNQRDHWIETEEEDDEEEEEEALSSEQEDLTDNGIRFYESVVQYLGGMLSAAELGGDDDSEILEAAISLGDRLVQAFADSKYLPGSRIFKNGTIAPNEDLMDMVSLSEVGTFQIEFRKLSQLSGNEKFTKIAQESFDYLKTLKTKVPGLYPAYFDPEASSTEDYVASFGSLSDSFYEYLLKTYILTGDVKFKELYTSTIDAMHTYLISRPYKKSESYLVLGVYDTATASLVPKMDHASCFAPGLLALGARTLSRTKDMAVARGLMETCYLSYKNSVTGLGADEIGFLGTEFSKGAVFEMPQTSGFYVIDPEYDLRPETIESLFILYRITGDAMYQDYAWEIAQAIEKNCRTRFGYSTLANVMDASEGMKDRMPSHFLAQTLKYLYLIFSPPDLASLDDYIFTTEGHLVKYPI
ncbi:hypothetical protein BGX27_001407 [Mortierella sp. AM989]|nr:hypothetical protein BGX27_001407 [Mortierella sp. AM989]